MQAKESECGRNRPLLLQFRPILCSYRSVWLAGWVSISTKSFQLLETSSFPAPVSLGWG